MKGQGQIQRMRRLAAYMRGNSGRLPGPASISLETTVRCNLKCPMCPRTGGNYPAEELPDGILYPLLEDFARLGGDFVFLYGLGEPLMDPRIFDILARCRSLKLGTILSTNGCFLDHEARRQLLDVGCSHTIVSIDGTDADTYGQYRVGGDFAVVEANLRALAAEKVRRHSKMAITAQMVCMEGNKHQQNNFRERWGGVKGVNAVRLKAEELGFEPRSEPILRESPCHILWRGPLIVRYTGEVFACHPMAAAEHSLGHLNTHSLESLWYGQKMTELRTLHGSGRWGEHADCGECPITRPKKSMAAAAMGLPGTWVQRLLPVAENLRAKGGASFVEE